MRLGFLLIYLGLLILSATAYLMYQELSQLDTVMNSLNADPGVTQAMTSAVLSNVALWAAVEDLVRAEVPTVVLGGGGYNPWTVARCWAGLWARLSDQIWK